MLCNRQDITSIAYAYINQDKNWNINWDINWIIPWSSKFSTRSARGAPEVCVSNDVDLQGNLVYSSGEGRKI